MLQRFSSAHLGNSGKRNLEVNCALENDLANLGKKIDFFEALAEDPLTSSTQEISSSQLLF